jgi:hypothetical protein
MARKTKKQKQTLMPKKDWIETDLPVVGELRDCRQISETYWQGVYADGTVLQVRGIMPAKRRLLVPLRNDGGYPDYGLLRLVPAAA